MNKMLNFEDWLAVNEAELAIADAESGADRELDYEHSYESIRERKYAQYVRGFII